ncbi:MAG TPA: hypothetical protein VGO40_07340 [Longimicrobium sp.]|jgi:tRNA A-37 threonylcarbamoyl transferase component Bud32|nr:hypothetical protein [Longimicrobium sp.]
MAEAALASEMLVLRRRSGGEPLALDPALEIGAGGEARVLRVPGDDTLVAKLYRDPTLGRAAKLARMMEAPPALAGAALAWPVDLLTAPNGRFAGFLMPRAEGPRLFELYNPVSRRRAAPLCDWGRMHRVGASLAAAFDALHGHGYVVGDVNESNILVSPEDASVTLVDADSFQVRDPLTGAVHRSGVGKAEFTPPELQGARFADVDRAPEHDRFGLAALLFLLLMEGTHPFAQRFEGDAEALPVEERIRRGLYPYARRDGDCRPPRLAPPIETLDLGLQALFARCFVDGQTDPASRPSAAEWRDALAQAEGALRACDANPQHRFAAHVPFCPWCHRRRLLQGRDPFPASEELARATDLAPLAPARPAPQQQVAPPPAAAVSILPRQAAIPGQLAVFLAGVQAALPPWLAGPTALGSPLPWAAPAALTILYGATGGLRVFAMMVGFLALRRLFRGGVGGFTRVTAMWVVALMLLWSIASGIVVGSYAAGDVTTGGSVDPGDGYSIVSVPQPEAAVLPGRRDAYEQADVDRAPYLVNQDALDEAVGAAVASAKWPASRSVGGAILRFVVNADGSVDPTTVTVTSAGSQEVASIATGVAKLLRFVPALKGGRPVAMWTDFTVSVPSRGR